MTTAMMLYQWAECAGNNYGNHNQLTNYVMAVVMVRLRGLRWTRVRYEIMEGWL